MCKFKFNAYNITNKMLHRDCMLRESHWLALAVRQIFFTIFTPMKATCGDAKQPEVALNTTSATLANLNPNTKTNKRTIYMC